MAVATEVEGSPTHARQGSDGKGSLEKTKGQTGVHYHSPGRSGIERGGYHHHYHSHHRFPYLVEEIEIQRPLQGQIGVVQEKCLGAVSTPRVGRARAGGALKKGSLKEGSLKEGRWVLTD